MKAGVAAMLFAADALARRGPFPGRIVLAALVDEEGMMAGAKDFVARGRADGVDGVICCEPEGGEICHVAKGALRLRVDLHGKMAHGAMPFQGRNPNRAVGAVLARAGRRSSSGCRARTASTRTSGELWVTPTVLRAGEPAQMNVMPADASMWIDVRTMPGGRPRRRSSTSSTRWSPRRRGVGVDVDARRSSTTGRPSRRPRTIPLVRAVLGRPRRGRRGAGRGSAACPARPTARC